MEAIQTKNVPSMLKMLDFCQKNFLFQMGSQDILDDSFWGLQKRVFGFSFGGSPEGDGEVRLKGSGGRKQGIKVERK